MPDTKITALTAIGANPIIPATFPIPMVDLTDTSMAASGTTKKVTVNQILGAGGTATLASATITGDLTVRTTGLILNTSGLGVGISPTSFGAGYGTIQVSGATGSGIKMGSPTNGSFIYSDNTWLNILTETNVPHRHFVNNQVQYTVQHPGVFTWFDGAGGTRMTLNSNGLAIGTTTNYGKLSVAGSIASFASATIGAVSANSGYVIFSAYAGAGAYISLQPTNSVGTQFEAARIDAAGNVGIGVAPLYKLHAVVTSGAVGAFRASTAAIARLLVGNTVEDVELKVNANGDGQLTAGASKYLGLGSGGLNDRVILDTSGNLLVGVTAAPSGTIGGSGFIADSNSRKQLHLATTASTSQVLAVFINPNGTVGTIETNGSSTAYNISSDYRLKEEVKPLTGALNRITALKPSTYKWKVDGSVGEGFIAHELAEVVPFAVSGQKDAVNEDGSIKTQGVDLSKIVPILVAAIQELTARVQTLEAK